MFHNLVLLLVRKHNAKIELVCRKTFVCPELSNCDVDTMSLICLAGSSAPTPQILQFLTALR